MLNDDSRRFAEDIGLLLQSQAEMRVQLTDFREVQLPEIKETLRDLRSASKDAYKATDAEKDLSIMSRLMDLTLDTFDKRVSNIESRVFELESVSRKPPDVKNQ
jgi:hypothetical protein